MPRLGSLVQLAGRCPGAWEFGRLRYRSIVFVGFFFRVMGVSKLSPLKKVGFEATGWAESLGLVAPGWCLADLAVTTLVFECCCICSFH